MSRRRSRGAALLAAMLTVTLVATLAAGALWQQWRAVEVESAERKRAQAQWLLTGALDWARLILREDMLTRGADHLAEPWAVPLEEARLATFLAADRDNNAQLAGTDVADIFLSGSISDRQALLNVRGLLATDNATARENFRRLFELLGLPPGELQLLVENLPLAAAAGPASPGAARPLMPHQVAQLTWLGLAPATVAALAPYVTLLPDFSTRVNLNTAPPAVLYAVGRNIGLADAQRLVAARANAHFTSVADAARLLPAGALPPASVDVRSSYFEVRGRLRFGPSVIEQRSLVVRETTVRGTSQARTLWRESASPAAGLQETATPRR